MSNSNAGGNRPNVINVDLKPITLSEKEGWFALGNDGDTYIVLRKGKRNKNSGIVVIEEGKVTQRYIVEDKTIDCSAEQIIVKGIDLCQELCKIMTNYDLLLEQYELEQRAKALEVVKTVVPKLPSEWEQLVCNISKLILEDKIVKTFYVRQGNKEVILGIYCYENGYFRDCERTLEKEIEDLVSRSMLLDAKMIPGLRGNILRKIEGKTLTPYEPVKKCLLFADKVFCWDLFLRTKDLEKSLLEPSPDLVVTHRVPWRINPEKYKSARAGLMKYVPPQITSDLVELFKGLASKSFKAFLDWVKYPGEQGEDAYPRVVLLLEIIGYTLYPHEYPFHKAILLVGEGSNGKSTYLRLIETILGEENVAGVSITELDPERNRFAAADLWNKLANIGSEPTKGWFDPELFKKLTGEDLVRFERKHRDAFHGHNYAKMIFSANELPQVTENTYAFWRRWIVIEFPNRFKPDPDFFDRTFTPDEIEGVIICALHAFRMVLERKGFTEQGTRDPREEWLARSNPVYKVVKRMLSDGLIEFTPDGFVVKKDLYELYKRYATMLQEEDEDVSILEQKDFTRHLTRYFPVRSGDKRIGGKKKHVYIGVKIKDPAKARDLIGDLETPLQDLIPYAGASQ